MAHRVLSGTNWTKPLTTLYCLVLIVLLREQGLLGSSSHPVRTARRPPPAICSLVAATHAYNRMARLICQEAMAFATGVPCLGLIAVAVGVERPAPTTPSAAAGDVNTTRQMGYTTPTGTSDYPPRRLGNPLQPVFLSRAGECPASAMASASLLLRCDLLRRRCGAVFRNGGGLSGRGSFCVLHGRCAYPLAGSAESCKRPNPTCDYFAAFVRSLINRSTLAESALKPYRPVRTPFALTRKFVGRPI